MDTDALLIGTKWEILSMLAKKASSPIEIAKKLGTTVANVSMQLRLLEVAKLVTKRRTTNTAAGKPRLLYSLQQDLLYVHAALKQTQTKQMIVVDDDKKITLKIWQLPKTIHGPLLKFYYVHQDLFDDENSVYFAEFGDQVFKIIVSNSKKPLPPKIITLKHKDTEYVVDIRFIHTDDIGQQRSLTLLHSPK